MAGIPGCAAPHDSRQDQGTHALAGGGCGTAQCTNSSSRERSSEPCNVNNGPSAVVLLSFGLWVLCLFRGGLVLKTKVVEKSSRARGEHCILCVDTTARRLQHVVSEQSHRELTKEITIVSGAFQLSTLEHLAFSINQFRYSPDIQYACWKKEPRTWRPRGKELLKSKCRQASSHFPP